MLVVDKIRLFLILIRFRRFLKHQFVLLHHFSLGIILMLFFCSCSAGSVTSPSGASQKQGTPQPLQVSLAHLRWCNQPQMLFRDEGAHTLSTSLAQTPGVLPSPTSTPSTITNWSQVQSNLGFTLYLPDSLPTDTCLMSAYGTVHDPIFGGSFTIAYLLPDHTSLSLSEAPLHSPHTDFQCSASNPNGGAVQGNSATGSTQGMQLCSGVRDTTNIVFSAQWPMAKLQTFFHSLQSDVEWRPAG